MAPSLTTVLGCGNLYHLGIAMKNYLKLLILAVLVLVVSLVGSLALQNVLDFGFQKIFHRLASILGIAAIILYMLFIQKKSPAEYGFTPRKGWIKYISSGAAIGLICISIMTLLEIAYGAIKLDAAAVNSHLFNILLINILAAAVIGVIEEFSFRGFLLKNLMEDFPVTPAILLTSAVYAAVHFVKSLPSPEVAIMKFVGLLLVGVLLAIAYLKTRSLYLPIGIHAGLVYFLKIKKAVFTQAKPMPEWVFGDKIMVGGVITWMMLILVIIFISKVNIWKKT
jgi:membrane protease YdiL (CAAX protease family)